MNHLQSSYSQQNSEQIVALSDTFTIDRYKQFARNLPLQDGKWLDVGCAEGRGGIELLRNKPDIILSGLDCVEERIAKLPPCYQDSIIGLTSSIPVGDLTFDAVIAGEFIEHLYPSVRWPRKSDHCLTKLSYG